MKKIMWLLCPLFLTLVASCGSDDVNDSEFIAGEEFTDNQIRVLKTEDLIVDTSTIKLDSVVTNFAQSMLVGKVNDDFFGDTYTSTFFEISPDTYNIPNDAEFQSATLKLAHQGYFFKDTTSANIINIRALTQKIEKSSVLNDTTTYYTYNNTDDIEAELEILGTHTYEPTPLTRDTLEISLANELFMEMFDKIKTDEVTNLTDFKASFNGLTITPGESSNAVIGYGLTNSYVEIAYTEADGTDKTLRLSIDLFRLAPDSETAPIPFFNRIVAENQNTLLTQLTSQKESVLPSSDADHKSFIQAGIGITTLIKFPNLQSLNDIEGTGTILNAVLRLHPVDGTYDNITDLPATLDVIVVNQDNDLVIVAGVAPIQAVLNETDKVYEVPLGNYINSLFLADEDNDQGIVLLPSNNNSTVNSVQLHGGQSAVNKTTLELTYAIYEN